MVLICFAAASFVVYRYTLISENHKTILGWKNSWNRKYAAENLEVELSYRKNLESVEFLATEMGMKYPEEGQVKYVDLPEKQTTVEHADASSRSLSPAC